MLRTILQGNDGNKTPNIDRIAHEGMQFTYLLKMS